ncbi:7799_t:CDS:2, partial [Racocetra fulgida]
FRKRDKSQENQPTEYQLINSLSRIKKENPFLKQVQASVLQSTAKKAYKTWKNYLELKKINPKKKYPNFKPHYRYNSFLYPQPIKKDGCGYEIDNSDMIKRLENRKLELTLGRQNKKNVYLETKIKMERNIEGDIKNLIIKRKNSKYYALFSCENIEPRLLPQTNKKVGLDLGIRTLITTSDGKKIKNPRFYKESKQIIKEAIINQFKHYSYQEVNKLVGEYDDIAVEDLNVKGMLEKKLGDNKKSLRRSLASVKFGTLLKVISEKTSIVARRLVRVNPKNTTQICSNCDKLSKEKIGLSQRIFKCWHCELELDRDINSAKNILNLGFYENSLHSGLQAIPWAEIGLEERKQKIVTDEKERIYKIGRATIKEIRGGTEEQPEGLGTQAVKLLFELVPEFSENHPRTGQGIFKDVYEIDIKSCYANIMRDYPLPCGKSEVIKDPITIEQKLRAGATGFLA